MEIVYLDQNKWIELARVQCGKISSEPVSRLYSQLLRAVECNRAIFPLSVSHVLETSKRNDPISRGQVAVIQAKLSRGYAYRSRKGRLAVEIHEALLRLFNIESPALPPHWAIAPGFLQAFEPMDSLIAPESAVERVDRLNAYIEPADQYVHFMTKQDDARRGVAHRKLAAGTADLVAGIEARRVRLSGESVDMRRRAYSVQLFTDHQDEFLRVLSKIGRNFEQLKAIGERAVRALVEDVPTLNVEAEMAARLESETGRIKPNDVVDIQSFYTAIPYSAKIIAEKGAVSRARQAKLDRKYHVSVDESLTSLLNVYVE